MKRCWIGFFLLLVLLLGGWVSTEAMDGIHTPLAEELDRAAEAALAGNWQEAERYAREAADRWKKWEHVRACFADHTPIEEIDADMKEMEVYCDTREEVAFAAACRSLSRKVAAVGEAHGLVWWNLL